MPDLLLRDQPRLPPRTSRPLRDEDMLAILSCSSHSQQNIPSQVSPTSTSEISTQDFQPPARGRALPDVIRLPPRLPIESERELYRAPVLMSNEALFRQILSPVDEVSFEFSSSSAETDTGYSSPSSTIQVERVAYCIMYIALNTKHTIMNGTKLSVHRNLFRLLTLYKKQEMFTSCFLASARGAILQNALIA